MIFEVTTLNRLTARKLLTQCGVRPDMARTMSLRQLQEHLSNFVELGTIGRGYVEAELRNAQAEKGMPPNAGASWTPQADAELADHFARGIGVSTMASIRGRTVGGIYARLCKLGLMEYNQRTNSHDITAKGIALRASKIGQEFEENEPQQAAEEGNNATQAGQFADAGAIAAMDAALALLAAQKARDTAVPNGNEVPLGDIQQELSQQHETDQRLAARVGALEGTARTHAGQISRIANDQATLQQSIADTIAAEVKKVQGAWQRFEIATHDKVHKIEGLAHKAFPKLLRAVSARTRHDKGALNIWLYGPAGTGKSTAARKLAEAFSMPFHTNGPVGSQWDIRGFTDAQGRIVETAFRRAWEGGGVYCWDEGDGSAPAALIEANGALATGFASFPDKVVQRHSDCIVIINGNLRPGAAPDATYNGRYKQDTAFVNRFVAIKWDIDEDLERALLGKLDAVGEQWLTFVRKLRKKIVERGIKGIVVSPRQLQYGLALLDAGAELDEVMEETVQFMFTDDQWKQVTEAADTTAKEYVAEQKKRYKYA